MLEAGRARRHQASKRLVFLAANAAVDRLLEVEAFKTGAINRPVAVVAVPGGKGLNAARVAHALGANVTAIAVVGGHTGAWIAERLAGEQIDARIVRVASESRICLSVLDRSDGRMTEFYEPGGAIEPSAWDDVADVLDAELRRGDCGAVVCSGSLPPGSPADVYARVVRMGRDRGVPVFVDAAGAVLAAALHERPALVKVNAREALEVSGLGGAPDRMATSAARWIVEHGAEIAVVTRGIRGAIGLMGGSVAVLRAPSVAVRGRYPVGSGDAFMAGLAVALVEGQPLSRALQAAMAAGTASASIPGAGRIDPILQRYTRDEPGGAGANAPDSLD